MGIDGFFGLVKVCCKADTASFGVTADPVEHSLVGGDGEEVEVKTSEGLALTWKSFARGRILPRKGRKISADSADFSGLKQA